MTHYELKLPGAAFDISLQAMKRNMRMAALAGDAVPFDMFFIYFDLTPSNATLKNALLARGSFVPIGGATAYHNVGPLIDYTITDLGPDHRTVSLFVGPAVTVEWTVTGTALELTFGDGQVLLGVDQIPPELGFGTSFVLSSIVWDDGGVKYNAVEDGVPDHSLTLFVDVSLTDGAFLKSNLRGRSPSARLRLLSRSLALDAPCCSGFEAKKYPPSGPLCINLHVKILVAPNLSIADQIRAMNDIYAPGQVTVRLQSTETLTLHDLEDLDVGACRTDTLTGEQATLFRNRKNAAAIDVCAYWVRNLIGGSGNFIGCASHPRGVPALAITGTQTTRYCLAHEMGHVLGLNHVPESDHHNLMRPIDDYTNPPPALTSDQFETMRWSPFLFSC